MRRTTSGSLKLRDRDAILTKEGIIFRVYGYFHPPNAYVCDVEYAPASIHKSNDPRALRVDGGRTYYKFYWDEGLRFVAENYPTYTCLYEPLQKRLVCVHRAHVTEVRKPDERFRQIVSKPPRDPLIKALHRVFNLVSAESELSEENFGVFGSILHGFYHPRFSDIDLIIYGRENLEALRRVLKDLYREKASRLRNEFDGREAIRGKRWKFVNYSPEEYLWHQRRKLIYALFRDEESKRTIKTEFEPVKEWDEIHNEYNPNSRIVKIGWVKAVAYVTNDRDSAFIPSIYQIEPIEILEGPKVGDVQRILSYVEEFRIQARSGEKVYVEGHLERVITPTRSFHQITLTYGPRYYEQVLKVVQKEEVPTS